MAIGGLSAANGVAKITGEGWFQLTEMTARLARMMSKGKGTPIGARGYELATEEDPNMNHGFPQEGGSYPQGNSAQTIQPTVYTRRMMMACRLTGASMDELGKNHENEMYTQNWVDLNLEGTRQAAMKLENWYGYGTGNGRLATVSTGATATTQTFTGSGAGYDWTRGLSKNISVQFIDPATGLPRNATGVTIQNSLSPFATTVTLSASVATTTGDYVVANGAYNNVQSGLTKIIDDGTLSDAWFQGVNRTTNPKYSANLLSPGGSNSISLSLSLMRRMLGGKMTPVLGTVKRSDFQIWSHEAQWSVMASLGWTLKRFEGSAKALDIGYTAIEWEGIPWTTEVDCPLDKVMFINWDTIWRFENTPWGWDEKTGSIWKNVINTSTGAFTDNFEGHYRKIDQNGSPEPQKNGMIYNLAVPVGYYY
jgi:hypothetical protein